MPKAEWRTDIKELPPISGTPASAFELREAVKPLPVRRNQKRGSSRPVKTKAASAGPALSVTAIMFNHDPNSTTDALNIRRNATEEVPVPEWTPQVTAPEQSPAAYSIEDVRNQVIRIKVQLTMTPPGSGEFFVRAMGGGVLGPVTRPQAVVFSGGGTQPAFLEFELRNHKVGLGGVLVQNIRWRWQFRQKGKPAWRPMHESEHRIYIVLKAPSGPWQSTPYPNTQNVWTEVLDYACTWARTAKNIRAAAARVTRAVNAPAGDVKYDMAAGVCHYSSPPGAPGSFDCTAYLDRLRNGNGSTASAIVNCTDCATINSTFANSVGCDLNQSVMGYNFDLNPIIAIGFSSFGFPNWGPAFGYHEVTWEGADAGDPVWDSCLKTNRNGSGTPQRPVLPTNSIFDNPYRPQLVPALGVSACQPQPGSAQRRSVI